MPIAKSNFTKTRAIENPSCRRTERVRHARFPSQSGGNLKGGNYELRLHWHYTGLEGGMRRPTRAVATSRPYSRQLRGTSTQRRSLAEI
jgi:hypothetical protein